MTKTSPLGLDRFVGKIAGAIYMDIAPYLKHRELPLVLVPAFTFKIKKILMKSGDVKNKTAAQIDEMGTDIQVGIIPLLFSYDINPDVIQLISPIIRSAVARVLKEECQID